MYQLISRNKKVQLNDKKNRKIYKNSCNLEEIDKGYKEFIKEELEDMDDMMEDEENQDNDESDNDIESENDDMNK